jgi:hypothetical protein
MVNNIIALQWDPMSMVTSSRTASLLKCSPYRAVDAESGYVRLGCTFSLVMLTTRCRDSLELCRRPYQRAILSLPVFISPLQTQNSRRWLVSEQRSCKAQNDIQSLKKYLTTFYGKKKQAGRV